MKPCCEKPENRREGYGPRGEQDAPKHPDLIVTYCVICSCRHFEVDADKFELGVQGAEL
jgi:hypothetical protein